MARPPSSAKIGAPQAAATSTSATSGQSAPADKRHGFQTSHAPTTSPHAATRLRRPSGPRAPDRADRDQAEGQRQHGLRHPGGDARRDHGARLALAHHQLERADAQHHRHGGRHRRRQHRRPCRGRGPPAGTCRSRAPASCLRARPAPRRESRPTAPDAARTGMEPGMPVPATRRRTISASGSTTITASAMPASASSSG